jgi:ppGpp synthetase/RelA/SpoT-type nucleotidyltranferase
MTTSPTLADIKRYLKSELGRIRAKGYGVEQIYDCVCEYINRAGSYKRLIENFSLQIQDAPAISKFVHSVRFRVKDPYHLAEKLARKCVDKNRIITADNLFDPNTGVTDLGGVRILHLRKDEWQPIHDYLVKPASMRALSVIGKTAYIKLEKKDEYRDRFRDDEIENREETGYTSLHYIFKGNDDVHGELFFECQVRTLFEEGWGEIDHQMNYPYKANSIIGGYLSSLNSSAHTANEIASKLETLLHIPLLGYLLDCGSHKM